MNLTLFGAARWSAQGRPPVMLERRAAALLALLALDGPTSRSELASLLYDSPAARNNLVHLLRRVNVLTAGSVRSSGGTVTLNPGVEVDVTGALTGQAALPGAEFLEGQDYSDLPDLNEWVGGWRERLTAFRQADLTRRASEAEAAGDLLTAAHLTEALLESDPLREVQWRTLIGLYRRLGQRSAALDAFRRCAAALSDVGASPAEDTIALVNANPEPAPDPRAQLPMAALRPPRLIGRDAEWARLHAALTAGRAVAIVGERGVGRSRLLQDLVAATPGAALLQLNPEDAHRPYSLFRKLIAATMSQSAATLPGWVHRELTRLNGEADGQLNAPRHEEEQTRFLQALGEALRHAGREGLSLVAVDDAQHCDPDSAAAWVAAWPGLRVGTAAASPRLAWSTRSTAQPTAWHDRPALAAVEVVQVPPLPVHALRSLLASLNLPDLHPHTPALVRRAAGHPRWLMEGVRHVIRSGNGLPEDAPQLPEPLQEIVAGRLADLSPHALQVARAAAVLDEPLRPDLVADLLGVPPVTVAVAWEELEAKGLVRDDAFTLDLLRDAVTRGTSDGDRSLLHRSAARHLTRQGSAPDRVARHWEAAGDARPAVEFYRQAARDARARWQLRAATHWMQRAARLLEQLGAPAEAFDLWAESADLSRDLTLDPQSRDVADHLLRLAATPHQRAVAWAAHLQYLTEEGDADSLEEVARRGLACLDVEANDRLAAAFLEAQAGSRLMRGRMTEALAPLRALQVLGEALPDPQVAATAHEGLGLALAVTDPSMSARHYDQAADLHARTGDLLGEVSVLNKRAPLLFALGDAPGAERAATRAWTLLEQIEGADHLRLITAHERFIAFYAQDDQASAHAALESGLTIPGLNTAGWGAVLNADLALLKLRTGELDAAERALEAAAQNERTPENKRHFVLTARILVHAALGQDVQLALSALARHAAHLQVPHVSVGARLMEAVHLPPVQAAQAAESALRGAQQHGLHGARRAALVLRARAHLAQGALHSAREDLTAALHAGEVYSLHVTPRQMLCTYADILERLHDPAATAAREAAQSWSSTRICPSADGEGQSE